jgi:hypothetical protein
MCAITLFAVMCVFVRLRSFFSVVGYDAYSVLVCFIVCVLLLSVCVFVCIYVDLSFDNIT